MMEWELFDPWSRFLDRTDAGQKLAARLQEYAGVPDVLVLALPRGGVAVAAQVAKTLGAPLDVFIVRKLGVPGYEELAMGALAAGDVRVLNRDVIRSLGITEEAIERVVAMERREVLRREHLYRKDRPPLAVANRTVIVVDDGLATGATMRAAVQALRQMGPAKLIVAVPVGARETVETLRQSADEVVCLLTPDPFNAIGYWYVDFEQLTDYEVAALLQTAGRKPSAAP